MPDAISEFLLVQDGLITRSQALRCMSDDDVRRRLGRDWQVVLPGVYAASPEWLSDRQRLRAALLHAGPQAVLSDTSALLLYGVPFVPTDPYVRVLVPAEVQRLSREFVVLRRTTRPLERVLVAGFPVASVSRAAGEFARRHRQPRDVLAVLAAIVQTERASLSQLLAETEDGPSRGRPALVRALEPIQAGIRSVAEQDFRSIVQRSKVLPEPLWNCMLRLPTGQVVSPDALFEDAALIHETNGRRFHAPDEAGEDRFDGMQRRHDLLVTTGFTLLHNAPRRLKAERDTVQVEAEACYLRDRGRGLPPGCVILQVGPGSHPAM